uniref:Uncharacterized protein n=1 Tax=Arundo donax TaxID=35708 RepID=A0A0A8Y7B1_ARUDO
MSQLRQDNQQLMEDNKRIHELLRERSNSK